MEIEATEVVKVNAKTLRLNLKVCDRFYASLLSDKGTELKDYEGYVPGFMPEEHFGDYVQLDIDIDTGLITNWVTPSAKDIEAFIDSDNE